MIEDLVISKSRLFTCGEQPKKEKCFAHKNGRCSLLLKYIKKDCKTCPFFKTQKQHEKDKEQALKRLKSLDEITKRNIAEKYRIKKESLGIPLQSIDRGL